MDIRKLQILNDRINYAMDALNQCRVAMNQPQFNMGVQGGLSHSSPWQQQSFMASGYPTYNQPVALPVPFAMPVAIPGFNGLSHTSPFVPQHDLTVPGYPYANTFGGLSHSTPSFPMPHGFGMSFGTPSFVSPAWF
jgi:hypothetical protein